MLRGGNITGITQSKIQENTELENSRPWWHTLIRILNIHVHPEQISSATE